MLFIYVSAGNPGQDSVGESAYSIDGILLDYKKYFAADKQIA
jgi:hypothetical protein